MNTDPGDKRPHRPPTDSISARTSQPPELLDGVTRALCMHTDDYMFATDDLGYVTFANPAYLDLVGKRAEAVIGQQLESILPLRNAVEHNNAENKVRESRLPERLLEVIYTPSGRVELETHKFALIDEQGELYGVGSRSRDLTVPNQLQRLQQLSETIFRTSREAIVLADAQGRIVRVNHSWEKMTGLAKKHVLGRRLKLLSSGHADARFHRTIWREVLNQGHWSGELVSQNADGSKLVNWTTINAMFKEDGHLLGYLAVQTNITDLRNAHERIDTLANTDELTSLPNRKQFLETLETWVAQRKDTHKTFALLMIDLDHFKDVNDTLGHQTGDKLLKQIAHRLGEVTRSTDIVARIGGDEFTLLIPVSDSAQTTRVAHRILQDIQYPMLVDDRINYRPQASMGIVMYPEDGKTAVDLLKRAEQAMYAAKHKGRNQIHAYSADLEKSNQRLFTLRRELADAVINHELRVFMQPVFNLETLQVCGAEALVRWEHPELGLLSPQDFLPVAQTSKMMGAIDRWMLSTTLGQVAVWKNQGLWQPGWRISINQNTDDLRNQDWSQTLEHMVKQLGLAPGIVGIELTEELWAEPNTCVMENLKNLQRLGMTLYIDDFGTGYSNLAYLKELPASVIKIDRHFVDHLKDEEGDATLVEAIIALGKKLNYTLIAEGIQTEYQLQALIEKGCKVGQGYLLSPPISTSDFEDQFLKKFTRACSP